MKKIEFVDVLGNERTLKTCIDLERQLTGLDYWQFATKRNDAEESEWYVLTPFDNKAKFYTTEEDAYEGMVSWLRKYIELSEGIGKRVLVCTEGVL